VSLLEAADGHCSGDDAKEEGRECRLQFDEALSGPDVIVPQAVTVWT
jgi:hypothetical protein